MTVSTRIDVVAQWDDNALLAACCVRPNEQRLRLLGFLGTLALIVGLLFYFQPWQMYGTNVIVVGTVAAWFVVCAGLALGQLPWKLRTRPFRRELERRYPLPRPGQLDRALLECKRTHPDAEWIVLLSMSFLPHGGCLSVALCARDEKAMRVRFVSRPLGWGLESWGQLRHCDFELPPDTAAALWPCLRAAESSGSQRIKKTVRDGLPAELLGWRRSSNRSFRLQGNLAALNDAERVFPAAELSLMLIQATRDKREILISGSCDAQGHVTLWES